MPTFLSRVSLLAAALLVLVACGALHDLPKCPPFCLPPPLGTATPTPTPTPSPTSSPTPTATAPSSTTPTPPAPTETPRPSSQRLTSGKAHIRVDLSSFAVATPYVAKDPKTGKPVTVQLDVYDVGTLLWDPLPAWPTKVRSPALALVLRGTDAKSMRLQARWSANVAYDGTPGLPESQMCGEGFGARQALALGAWPTVGITVEWAPGLLRVSTPGGSRELHQHVEGPGFGYFVPGVPRPPKGIGWSYSPDWSAIAHGGLVEFRRFEAVGPQSDQVAACP